MVGRCERATEKQHINGCGTIMNNTCSWSWGNVGGVLVSYPAACNPPRILPSPLAKVCNRQHKWSLFYGVCIFTWLLRQWLPLKHRQHGNELRTRISQHCLLESWNYLLSFPRALKCNHYFTLLSSRWLSMNPVSAWTDAQSSPALQCPHSYTFLLQISAEGNFKYKFKLNWEKLGGEILHVCEEVEKREKGWGKGEDAYKVLFRSFQMLAALKARATLLSLLTKQDAGTTRRRKGES